ncbi:MAG: hypothetical protein RTU63_04405, partial [Candidatus Thorarchaeota archaeon]
MNAQNSRKISVLVITTLFILSPLLVTTSAGQTNPSDLTGKNIALYYGDPSSSTSSRTALHAMFTWMNASVDVLY